MILSCSPSWVATFDNTFSTTAASAVAFCSDGSVFVGGSFLGYHLNITDSTGVVVSRLFPRYSHMNSIRDFSAAYFAKFNLNGHLLWAKEWSGPVDAGVTSMTCDAKNRIIMGGRTGSASASATGTNLGNYWLSEGRAEPTGSIFIEAMMSFPPVGAYSGQSGFPIFSSAAVAGYQHVQVDSNHQYLRFWHRTAAPTANWANPLAYNMLATPTLANRTGLLGITWDWPNGNQVQGRFSWNNVAFAETTPYVAFSFMAQPISPGSAGYLRRPEDGWVAWNGASQGGMRMWRGLRTMVAVNSDGDHIWSRALNHTGNDVGLVSSNGLITIAGVVPNTGTIEVHRYLDQGSRVWTASIFGLVWTNRTDVQFASVNMDSEGNVAVVGRMGNLPLGIRDFSGAQVATIDSNGTFSGFIVVFDSYGQFKWANSISSFTTLQMSSVAIDRLGNVAVACVTSSLSIMYNASSTILNAFTQHGAYIFRFSSEGNILDTSSLRGSGSIDIKILQYAPTGELFVGGDFSGGTISVYSQYENNLDIMSNSGNIGTFALRFDFILTKSTVIIAYTSSVVSYTSTLDPQTTPVAESTGSDFFANLINQLGMITLIVILVLIIVLCGFMFFAYRLLMRYVKIKAGKRIDVGTYFTVDDFPVSPRERGVPKLPGTFPTHLELRNNFDFKQGERLPTGPETFLFKCTLRGANGGHQATMSRGHEDVVIKIIAKSEALLKEDQKFKFNMEVTSLWKLKSSKNIMKLIGFCIEPVGLIMRQYRYGSLSHWIYASSESPA